MSNRYSLDRTNRLRYCWLLLVAFLFSTNVWAQVSAYSFSQSSGTYTSITGGTVLATASASGNQFDSQVWTIASGSFPFSFTFNGSSYTGCYISSNGFITFGTSAPGAFTTTPLSTSITGTAGKIAAWAGDLNTYGNIAGRTGEVRWEVVGTAPNREVVIQLANWRPAYSTSTTAVYSFDIQFRLGENGNVSIVYGNVGGIIGTPTNPGTLTRQIGLGGATTTDYNNRTNTASVLFTSSSAGTANSATQAYSYTGTPPGMPSNGLTYTWAPPAPCVTVTAGGSASPATLNTCSGTSFTLNVTGATTNSAAGISYQWYSSPDDVTYNPIGGATSATLNTSTTTSTYYRRETICLLGSSSLNSASAFVTVLPNQGFPEPLTNAATLFPSCGWTSSAATTFVRGVAPSAYNVGTGSVIWDFFSTSSGTGDYTTPTFTPTVSGDALYFDYAYRAYDGTSNDQLVIRASSDGGTTYTNVVTYSGASANPLVTAGVSTTELNTPLASEWGSTFVLLPAGTNRIQFRGISGFGNNLFVDNINVAAGPSCVPPTALTVSGITLSSANLGWTAGGTETLWNIEYGAQGFTQGTGTVISGLTSNSYNLTGLSAETSYAFYVQADCGGTGTSSWAGPFNFFTGYCSVAVTNGGDYISNFSTSGGFTNINSSGASTAAYENLTAQSVSAAAGQTINFAGAYVGGAAGWGIWIDWNNDLVFDNATERFYNPGATTASASGSITVPALQANGNYRMRVRGEWGTGGLGTLPCGLEAWGQTEDYTFIVADPPACLAPTAGFALNVAATSAEVNWTEAGTATNWDIEYGVDGFTLGTGILVEDIVSLPYAISGLSAGTAYDVYYRADCGGAQSTWSGPISFTTAPGCGSTWTDTGGAGGNYVNNENYVVTICPDVPGEVVSVNFTSWAVESGWDYMLIYDGNSTAAPQILSGQPAGSGSPANSFSSISPGLITSTSGCLTFRFVSDNSTPAAGWVAAITCAAPPTCGAPSVSGVSPSFNAVSFTINASATGTPVGYEYEIVGDGVTPTGTGTASATNAITATGLTPTTAYDLYVRTDCGTTDGFSVWVGPISFNTVATPPANYDCANAIAISCATPLVSGTTVNALLDPNYVDAGAGGTAPQRGVWYTIVGDDNQYTINTCSSTGFDSRLSVYSGSCGALVPVTGNDDMDALCAVSGVRSQVTFNANAGTNYYIYVHSFSTFTQAAFELNVSCSVLCPPPANDACASAQVLTQASTCSPVSGTTVCATNTPGLDNPFFGSSSFSTINDVWYQFTATAADGYLLFDNLTASGLYYTIYFEDPCGGSEDGESGVQGEVVEGAQIPFIGAVIGDTYWLRVNIDPVILGAADGSFDLCVVSLPCATPVNVDAVATSATNVQVTHDGIAGDAYIIEYGPAGFTPGTGGTAGVGGTIVSTTTLVTNVTVGSGTFDFYARKDCSGASEGYSLNQFGGTVSTPPVNDNCADAIAVTCGSTTSGTTQGATTSTGETAAGVWYTFEGNNSTVTATTCGTTMDTFIQIYTGDCGGPYTSIASNDDFCAPGSQVSWFASTGITYRILVRNFGSFTTPGTFDLTLSCVFPPANDNCATAQAITCGSSVNGTTVGASTSTGETTAGVWYSIVGDGSTISVSTCGGASWNTYIQVYTGACGGPYTSVAFNDNACGNQSTVSFLSSVGETYYIVVRGIGGASGTFTLTTLCQNLCATNQNAGTVIGQTTVCSGVSFTLNATNQNIGNTYQWQRRTATTNWTNIAGANSASLTVTQTVATDYRVRIGCNGSTTTNPSGFLSVAMTPFANCYCATAWDFGTSDGDWISNVTLGSINNSSGASASPYITNYAPGAGTTTTLLRSGTYNGSVTVATSFGGMDVAVWVDFNRNGSFELSERVAQTPGDALDNNQSATVSFTVPATASLGTTRMRVIADYFNGDIDPCGGGFGETEDYTVTIANGSANDNRANATSVNPSQYPACSNLSGNLVNATPSAAGQGNDLWYSFVAESNAVRIQLTGSGDNLIELEDAAGTTIEEANLAGGSETLANGTLTPGATYYVAIRNVSSPASFTVCIQTLAPSTCDSGPVFTSLCNTFKADWTGTANYVATFTETAAPFASYTANINGSTSIPLRNIAGLRHGRSYDVSVNAVFTFGAEVITAQSTTTCPITITQHPLVNLRTADADPNTRTIGAFIGTDVLVCGNTDWEWTFELVDGTGTPIGVEGPVSVITGSTSRYIRTSQIPGVSAGNRYRVRVRPIFGAESGVFDDATFRYLQIAGSAGMVDAFDGEVAPEALLVERNTENGVFAALYPNPNNGDMVNLNIAGLDSESVQVRIFDATGRVVFSNRYVVEGALNTIVSFPNPLTAGMYIVEMTFGNEVITERMMVSK